MNKIFFCLLFLFVFITGYSSNQVDSLFTQLDKEIDNRKVYDSKKESRIFNLKKLISEKDITPKNKYFLTKNLINEYQYYSFDSTLYYIEENIKLGQVISNPYFSQESTLKLAEILAMSGRFKEAIDILNEIDKQSLPKELFKDYYLSYKKCFSELLPTSKVNRIKINYDDLYNAYKDSLDIEVSNLKLSSLSLLAIEEQNYRDLGKFKEALDINGKRMSLLEMGTRDYSLVTFERSYTSFDFYKNRVDQKKYLILSAISDIKASVKDNASLANLAVIFFEEGNVDKAHRLISLFFEDAKFYNSKLRFLNISNTLPVISKSFDERNLEQRNKLKKQKQLNLR